VLEQIAGGQGRLVLLDGEPGVGKTRLAQEVLVQAQERGGQVLVGRCFEQYLSVPFFPFTEALTCALAGVPRAQQVETTQRWPELVHLVPEFNAGAAPPRLEGQDTQLRVFRAATSFLHTLAEATPLVLLLDDLHWADTTSLGLLLYLCRYLQAARILVLGT